MTLQERTEHPMEVRVALLEAGEERTLKHHEENKVYLEKIWTKLNAFSCQVHQERMNAFRNELTGMWCVVSVVFFILLVSAVKLVLKA